MSLSIFVSTTGSIMVDPSGSMARVLLPTRDGPVLVYLTPDQLDRLIFEATATQRVYDDLDRPYQTNDPDDAVNGV
jgi:hypothetical protein